MTLPLYIVRLNGPTGLLDITSLIDRHSIDQIEYAIEEPGVSNQFRAATINVTGYDPVPGVITVSAMLSDLTPQQFVGVGNGVELSIHRTDIATNDMRFIVIPESIVLNADLNRQMWSFTAVGSWAWMSKIDASSLFRQNITGYTVVAGINTSVPNVLTVTKIVSACELKPGMIATIGRSPGVDGITAKIVYVFPTLGQFFQWDITFEKLDFQYWFTGTPVEVLDFPQENVLLKDVVDALLIQSQQMPTLSTGYNVRLLANPSNPFRSGLANGNLPASKLGLAANGTNLVAGTSTGAYVNVPPPQNNWSLLTPGATTAPVDPTNMPNYAPFSNVAPQYYGDRHIELGPSLFNAFENHNYAYYRASPFTGIMYRAWLFTYYNESAGVPGNWVQTIQWQSSTGGGPWIFVSTAFNQSGTTSTYLPPYLNQNVQAFSGTSTPLPVALGGNNPTAQCMSIAIIDGVAFFTEIYNTGAAGSPIGFRLSYVNFLATGTTATSLVTGVRGYLVAIADLAPFAGPILYLFFLDRLNGNQSQLYIYNVVTFLGVFVNPRFGSPKSWSIFFRPETLKRNEGFSLATFCALSYSVGFGVRSLTYHQFNDPDLSTGPNAIDLFAPVSTGISSITTTPADFTNTAGVIDLAVIPVASIPAGGGILWPCAILSPEGMFWVDYQWSGILEKVDLKGLSCGDALAQLAVLVNAFTYPSEVAGGATSFRTRDLTSSTSVATIANPSAIIDDAETVAGGTDVKSNWSQVYLYVRVTNDADSAIVGEAGNPGYRGTEQGHEMTSRFVLSAAFADAVALMNFNYFSKKHFLVSLARPSDDGRDYSLGNSCHLNLLARDMQITKKSRSLWHPVIKLELIEY